MNLTELLKTRRTRRKFQQREIPDDAVKAILQAQQYASCGRNRQHLRYVVIRTPELRATIFPYTHWAALLPKELGSPREDEQPMMYILVLDTLGGKNARAEANASLAISNMTLVAWDHGIGSCILGNFDRAKVKELLEIPDGTTLMYLVAFGFPADKVCLEEIGIEQSTDYYLDTAGSLIVPKYKASDIVTYR